MSIGEEHDDLSQKAVAAAPLGAQTPAATLLQEKRDGLGAQEQTFVVSMVLRFSDWAKIIGTMAVSEAASGLSGLLRSS